MLVVVKATLTLLLIVILQKHTQAETHPSKLSPTADVLTTCEEQLSKYRKFILQAILSFEDVCDAYTARPNEPESLTPIFHSSNDQGSLNPSVIFHFYQPPEHRAEIWTFFKLLMAQFSDIEFTAIIRDAVIERCQVKSLLQRDEKRNAVVLGKKQRFHSWGGKRAPPNYYGRILPAGYGYAKNDELSHTDHSVYGD